MEIMNFRLSSTFYLKPILHTFPKELSSMRRKINILRDRFLFYTEEAAIFEAILSICSEFHQIGTPHFSFKEDVISEMMLEIVTRRRLATVMLLDKS